MTNSQISKENFTLLSGVFEALRYAAYKHRRQKRKGAAGIPYINHPIEVASLLVREVREPSPELIVAALLHDVIEDTRTRYSDLEERFGTTVAGIVREVTDDMTLPHIIRKRKQIEKAKSLSYHARCIKIADKTCNIGDVLFTRLNWSRKKKIEYITWANNVVLQIRETHDGLIAQFDKVLMKAAMILNHTFKSS